MSLNYRHWIVILVTLLSAVGVGLQDPIPQSLKYHEFADQRTILGIPHFGDVLSNLPFLFTGIWGLILLVRYGGDRSRFGSRLEIWPLAVAFLGIALVGPGSAYYHWNPNNPTLFWDRLPIAVGFMGILCMTVADRLNLRLGVGLLGPLALLAGWSVLWWIMTEERGAGDLRLYVWVVFFPMLAIPLLMMLFPPRYEGSKYVVWMMGLYVVAKVLEFADMEVFTFAGGIVSGHTLKHLFAAAATVSLGKYILHRKYLGNQDSEP